MRVLLVHPSPLMFSEIYLRLEPLGVECVAAALQSAGYEVRLLDLQVFSRLDYRDTLKQWQPDAVGFSLNYLANVPEVVDLAREAKTRLPRCNVFVGGHSASFITSDLLVHADGAIDCVVRGEGELAATQVLKAFEGSGDVGSVPGVVTADGFGPPPLLLPNPEKHMPARALTRRRREILHRRARSLCVHRIYARVPMGLFFL